MEYDIVNMRTPGLAPHQILWPRFWGIRIDYELTDTERNTKPHKSVDEKHYMWNEITLMGHIGGTLSLTMGFSFIGALDWLASIFSLMWKKALLKITNARGNRN